MFDLGVFSQTVILVGGALTVYLLSHASTRKDGWWMNAAVEPFWFFTAYKNEQWGIFLLAVVYTYCIIRGLLSEYGVKDPLLSYMFRLEE